MNALLVQIVAAIVGVIGMVVDGAVTGSCLGTDAMAAFGLVTPVVTIFVACSGVCELGASVLVGRLVGARKTDEASDALSTCLLFAIALSAVMAAAVFAFSRPIAVLLGAEGVIADKASDYLRGFSLCAPALLTLTVLMPIMQIDGKRKELVISVVIMTAVNITGDLLVGLFIRGGLLGMALATTVSYYAALVFMLPHFFRKDNTIRISVRCFRPAYIGEMLSAGLPNALQQVCRSLLIIVMNRLLLRISDSGAVAVFTAIMSAANLCMVLGSGIGSAVSMLTGVFAGERDDEAIRELVRTAIAKAVVYDAVMCAVLIAGAGIIMPMFTKDPDLLRMAVLGFRLYSLSMIGYSINVTFRLYYQAMRLSLLSYIYVFCNSFLFTAAGALLLGSIFGINGVWLAFLFGETLTLVCLAGWILLRKDRSASFADRFLMIPETMTADIISRYDGSASGASEMAGVSEEIRRFCIDSGADSRTAFILSLAAEELGEYILQNNTAASGRETVEVRVLHKVGGWTLRIRDNGIRFNPLELLEKERADDFSYIGIKLIKDLSDDISYLDTLNINNLLVEISE